MKIAVWHNLPSGGGRRALYYHVRGLVQLGHTVEVWCPSTADTAYLPLNGLAPEHIIPLSNAHRNRGRLERYVDKWQSRHPLEAAMDELCHQCVAEIEARDFDLLFSNSCTVFWVPRIARHAHLPNVLYLQEPNRRLYEAGSWGRWLPWIGDPTRGADPGRPHPRRALREWRELRRLRRAAREEWLSIQAPDRVLANSYFSRESIYRAYGRIASVCYLGVDTDWFRDLDLPRERFVVGLGSFHSIKGVDLAIEAIGQIPPPRPPLVWIGNSGNSDYMTHLQTLALRHGVDFRPKSMIPDEDVIDLLNRASVMLYTSRLEPFGYAPLEAGACGTPVVAVADGGVRETLCHNETGLLADPSPSALAEAVAQLLDNPTMARDLGTSARAYIQDQWSVEASVRRLEEQFFDLLSVNRANQQIVAA